jgi:hypothetical protein
MVETAWNPLKLSWPSFKQVQRKPVLEREITTSPSTDSVWPGYNPRLPPRLLQLADTPNVDSEQESILSTVPHDSVVGESSKEEETPPTSAETPGDSSAGNTTQATSTLTAMLAPASHSSVGVDLAQQSAKVQEDEDCMMMFD